MQTQTDPRIRKRVPCKLSSRGREHSGMILNLSRGGLFVQTGAQVAPGDQVDLELNLGRGQTGIPVRARVVWRRTVMAELRSVAQGGFGVRIRMAPEHYFDFLSQARNGSTRPPAAAAAPLTTPAVVKPGTGVEFRLRLKQTSGPRTRSITVESASEADARRRALNQLGDDWVVLECERAAP